MYGKWWLLLAAEDTIDVNQYGRKGQKSEENNKNNRVVMRCSIETCPVFYTKKEPKWSMYSTLKCWYCDNDTMNKRKTCIATFCGILRVFDIIWSGLRFIINCFILHWLQFSEFCVFIVGWWPRRWWSRWSCRRWLTQNVLCCSLIQG